MYAVSNNMGGNGSGSVSALGNSSDAPEPKFFGFDTPFDEVLDLISLVGVAYSAYDLYKKVKWIFFPDLGFNSTYVNRDNQQLGVDPSNAIAAAFIGDFMTYGFTDFSIESFFKKMYKEQEELNKDPHSAFFVPYNYEKLHKLSNGDLGGSDIRNYTGIVNYIDDYNTPVDHYEIYPIKTFVFYDVFPVKLSHNDYDWDDNTKLTTFNVTFRFTHFEQK
jgi:hypothetical protein